MRTSSSPRATGIAAMAMTMTMMSLMALLALAMMTMAWGCSARTALPARPGDSSPASASGTAPATPSGAAASTASGASAASVLSVDDQIREAVFRYQFGNNASGQRDRAPVYFLSLDEIDSLGDVDKRKDPSPALMARFAQHRPRVEPVSHAKVSFNEGVRHRDTGERGIIFRITAINRVSDDTAVVTGGYYEGNLSSSGNTYLVARKGGVWVVTSDKMEWIS